MKQLIERAVKIAHEYRELGEHVGLPLSWNDLTYLGDEPYSHQIQWGIKSKYLFRVYFADRYETCSVGLGSIEVQLYTNKITFDFDIDSIEIENILEEASRVLKELKENKLTEALSAKEEYNKNRILKLEKELKLLKGE